MTIIRASLCFRFSFISVHVWTDVLHLILRPQSIELGGKGKPADFDSSKMADMSVEDMTTRINQVTDEVRYILPLCKDCSSLISGPVELPFHFFSEAFSPFCLIIFKSLTIYNHIISRSFLTLSDLMSIISCSSAFFLPTLPCLSLLCFSRDRDELFLLCITQRVLTPWKMVFSHDGHLGKLIMSHLYHQLWGVPVLSVLRPPNINSETYCTHVQWLVSFLWSNIEIFCFLIHNIMLLQCSFRARSFILFLFSWVIPWLYLGAVVSILQINSKRIM